MKNPPIVETATLRLMAEDGCVVLYDLNSTESRLVLTRGQAIMLANVVKSFSLDLFLALRRASDYCAGTDLSSGEDMSAV